MPRFINLHASKRRQRRNNAIKFQSTRTRRYSQTESPAIVTPIQQRKENLSDEAVPSRDGPLNNSYDCAKFEIPMSPEYRKH